MCRLPSTSARFSFQIKAIVEHVDGKRRRKRKAVTTNLDQKEIAPFGRDPPAHDQARNDDDDDEDDEGNDSQNSDEEDDDVAPERTVGNLLFPCPSCHPDNATGYVCPQPIPVPTPQQIQDEQAIQGNQWIVGPPARGEWINVNILTVKKANRE